MPGDHKQKKKVKDLREKLGKAKKTNKLSKKIRKESMIQDVDEYYKEKKGKLQKRLAKVRKVPSYVDPIMKQKIPTKQKIEELKQAYYQVEYDDDHLRNLQEQIDNTVGNESKVEELRQAYYQSEYDNNTLRSISEQIDKLEKHKTPFFQRSGKIRKADATDINRVTRWDERTFNKRREMPKKREEDVEIDRSDVELHPYQAIAKLRNRLAKVRKAGAKKKTEKKLPYSKYTVPQDYNTTDFQQRPDILSNAGIDTDNTFWKKQIDENMYVDYEKIPKGKDKRKIRKEIKRSDRENFNVEQERKYDKSIKSSKLKNRLAKIRKADGGIAPNFVPTESHDQKKKKKQKTAAGLANISKKPWLKEKKKGRLTSDPVSNDIKKPKNKQYLERRKKKDYVKNAKDQIKGKSTGQPMPDNREFQRKRLKRLMGDITSGNMTPTPEQIEKKKIRDKKEADAAKKLYERRHRGKAKKARIRRATEIIDPREKKKKTVRPDSNVQKVSQRIAEMKVDKDHNHKIQFRVHEGSQYRRASLAKQEGKYAKYWLLNAKQTNGNGWGVSQTSIAKNISKFIGRPFVITAKQWVAESEYGDQFEHPYLPTNNISQIINHQEKFRVGSIVDVIEKDGDYHAVIEMNSKFANMMLPPFCSPAIFQNNPGEADGQISDWEALHLAGLMEDPAYGARIALLKGSCVGTADACSVQFKSAKQAKMVCPKKMKNLKGRLAGMNTDGSEDLTDEYEGKGKVAPPRVSEGFQTPRIVRHKGTILQPGKREAYPMHQDYDFKSEFQRKYEKKKPFKGRAKALKHSPEAENRLHSRKISNTLEEVGDVLTISEANAEKWAKLKTRLAAVIKPKKADSVDNTIDKLVKNVKDPTNKEDLVKRLGTTPNEHGPKNYGATKAKDFSSRRKVSKKKQKISKVRRAMMPPEDPLNWLQHYEEEGFVEKKSREGYNFPVKQLKDESKAVSTRNYRKKVNPPKLTRPSRTGHGATWKGPGTNAAYTTLKNLEKGAKTSKLKQRLAIIDSDQDEIAGDLNKINKDTENLRTKRTLGIDLKKLPGNDLEARWQSLTDQRVQALHRYYAGDEKALQLDNELEKLQADVQSEITTRATLGTPTRISDPKIPKRGKGKISKLRQRLALAVKTPYPNPKNSYIIRLKKGLTDMGWHPRYMNYAIQNQVNQGWAKKYQMGTAQQFIRKNDLAKMDIYDANLDITMKLNEVADILPGTTPTQAGDTMFQRTGTPGKNRYYDEPELTGKLKQRLAVIGKVPKILDSVGNTIPSGFPYYVTSRDTYMSGWGPAKGKNNRLIFAAFDKGQIKNLKRNMRNRGDQDQIKVHKGIPKLDFERDYIQSKGLGTKERYEKWYEDDKKGFTKSPKYDPKEPPMKDLAKVFDMTGDPETAGVMRDTMRKPPKPTQKDRSDVMEGKLRSATIKPLTKKKKKGKAIRKVSSKSK